MRVLYIHQPCSGLQGFSRPPVCVFAGGVRPGGQARRPESERRGSEGTRTARPGSLGERRSPAPAANGRGPARLRRRAPPGRGRTDPARLFLGISCVFAVSWDRRGLGPSGPLARAREPRWPGRARPYGAAIPLPHSAPSRAGPGSARPAVERRSAPIQTGWAGSTADGLYAPRLGPS